jgi:hypothetical protein
VVPGLPSAFDEWTRRGLAKRPEDRFADSLEMADALCAVIGRPISRAKLGKPIDLGTPAYEAPPTVSPLVAESGRRSPGPIDEPTASEPHPAPTHEAQLRRRRTLQLTVGLVIGVTGLLATIGAVTMRTGRGPEPTATPAASSAPAATPAPVSAEPHSVAPPIGASVAAPDTTAPEPTAAKPSSGPAPTVKTPAKPSKEPSAKPKPAKGSWGNLEEP